MTRPTNTGLLLACFLIVPALPAVAAGPFGVSPGDDPAKFPACQESNDGWICDSLPEGHEAIQEYRLFAAPGPGVCEVVASGRITGDPGGAKTRKLVDRLAQQTRIKYCNRFRKFDTLYVGADLEDPHEWLMAVKADQRTYSYWWTPSTGFSPRDGASVIKIEAVGESDSVGAVKLIFQLDNHEVCHESMLAQETAAY